MHSSLVTRHSSLIVFLLLLCGGLAFLPSLGGYFLSDDFVLLSWTRVGTAAEVVGFFDPATEWFYRPLVKVHYWVGQSLFGMRGVPFHVVSMLLHVVNGFLLYKLVVRQRVVTWSVGLLVALLFLLNPRHAETVSWVAAVGDVMGATYMLGSMLLFSRFVERGGFGWLVGSLALFAAALLARESAVLLPVLLGLYVLLLVRGPANRKVWLATYFVLLLAYVVFLWVGRGGEAALSRGGLQFRSLNLDSLLLGVMDYVHGLVPGGGWLASGKLDTLRWLVWVEAGALMGLAWLFWWWKRRLALLGLGWLLVTPLVFVPFSGPTDRYFYLPSIGFALIVGDLLGALPGVGRREGFALFPGGLVAALAAGLVVAGGTGVFVRSLAWNDAGRVSGGILNDTRRYLPDPPDGTRFYYAGVPPFLDGVPLFGNGLQEAVRLIYDNSTLSAIAVTCEPTPPPSANLLRFKGDGVEPVLVADVCP